jgi:hypothetical protein
MNGKQVLKICIHNKPSSMWVFLMRYMGPCHDSMAHPWVVAGGDGLKILRVAVSILNKQSQTTDKEWSYSLGVGAGHVAHMLEKRNAYKILARKPEEKRPLERPRHRWENNIRVDLREQCGKVWNIEHLAY